jgi:hypothetical protein
MDRGPRPYGHKYFANDRIIVAIGIASDTAPSAGKEPKAPSCLCIREVT